MIDDDDLAKQLAEATPITWEEAMQSPTWREAMRRAQELGLMPRQRLGRTGGKSESRDPLTRGWLVCTGMGRRQKPHKRKPIVVYAYLESGVGFGVVPPSDPSYMEPPEGGQWPGTESFRFRCPLCPLDFRVPGPDLNKFVRADLPGRHRDLVVLAAKVSRRGLRIDP